MFTLGIDIGSATSKCLILKNGHEIISSSVVTAGIGTKGPSQALAIVLENCGLSQADIHTSAVTGYGRIQYKDADLQVSELTCHALGGRFIFPEVRTIIDIGGQDVKAIYLDENGRMKNFIMNDKCAAGTGRFLDVMAKILQLDVSELEAQAAISTSPATISNTCTVFAESEVISQLANGVGIPDLVAGICNSVAVKAASLAKRQEIFEQVCMSGGVARNGAVRASMERALSHPVLFSPFAQLFGALGASLFAYQKSID